MYKCILQITDRFHISTFCVLLRDHKLQLECIRLFWFPHAWYYHQVQPVRFKNLYLMHHYLWINIDDFSISFVLEQQSVSVCCNYLKIGSWIKSWCLCFPVIEAQIWCFWQQSFLPLKVHFKAFRLESMSEIYVTWDFLTLLVLVSNEDDTLEVRYENMKKEII